MSSSSSKSMVEIRTPLYPFSNRNNFESSGYLDVESYTTGRLLLWPYLISSKKTESPPPNVPTLGQRIYLHDPKDVKLLSESGTLPQEIQVCSPVTSFRARDSNVIPTDHSYRNTFVLFCPIRLRPPYFLKFDQFETGVVSLKYKPYFSLTT